MQEIIDGAKFRAYWRSLETKKKRIRRTKAEIIIANRKKQELIIAKRELRMQYLGAKK